MKNSNTTKEEKLEQGLKLGSQIGVEIKMSKKSIFVGSDLKSRMYCRPIAHLLFILIVGATSLQSDYLFECRVRYALIYLGIRLRRFGHGKKMLGDNGARKKLFSGKDSKCIRYYSLEQTCAKSDKKIGYNKPVEG